MTDNPEQVLTIPRSIFIEQGPFEGFKKLDDTTPDLGIYLQGAPVQHARFMNRDQAEASQFHKQIIPYCILLSEDKVFLYRRGKAGSEQKLHDKYSIGIGGHINPEDDEEPFLAFIKGAVREVKEEVGLDLDPNIVMGAAIGLVNDESNQVGAVHLGVVLTIKIAAVSQQQIVDMCEDTLVEAQWVPLYELENPDLKPRLETWSQFVADHMLSELSKDAKWEDKAFRERVGLLAISASNLVSSAVGLLMQETPRGHVMSRKMTEEGAGEVQCMLAGLIANDDIDGNEVKKNAKDFHSELGRIVKYQTVTEKTIIEKIQP
jgi:predicted NUDIX family phosphoesterase